MTGDRVQSTRRPALSGQLLLAIAAGATFGLGLAVVLSAIPRRRSLRRRKPGSPFPVPGPRGPPHRRWTWRETSGGFAGVRISPEDDGRTAHLTLRADGPGRTSAPDSPDEEGAYRLVERRSVFDPAGAMVPAIAMDGRLDALVTFPDDSTLVIQDNVVDGYTSRYVRERTPGAR